MKCSFNFTDPCSTVAPPTPSTTPPTFATTTYSSNNVSSQYVEMVDKEFDEQTIKDLLEDAWDSANPGMGQKVKAYLSIQMYFHVLSTFRNLYQL